MLLRFGCRSFQKNIKMKCVIMILLAATFLLCISITTAFVSKVRKYSQVADALKGNGVYITSSGLYDAESGYNLKDEKDLREQCPHAQEIWSSSVAWYTFLQPAEEDYCVIWSYSQPVIEHIRPELAEGRWFTDGDIGSDVLKGVVCTNGNGIRAGDRVPVYDPSLGAESEIEIIGVLEDNASLFGYNVYANDKEDYRMLYYTYSYEREENTPLILIMEEQILANEDKGWFPEWNYRLDHEVGIHKTISDSTIITFPEDMSWEEIDSEIASLRKNTPGMVTYPLDQIRRNSLQYVYQELRQMLPIVLCILVYILVITFAIIFIQLNSELRNLSIYALCGLPWKSCAWISVCEAGILTICSAVVAALLYMVAALKFPAVMKGMEFGWLQFAVCMAVACLYCLFSYLVSRLVLSGNTPKDILRETV